LAPGGSSAPHDAHRASASSGVPHSTQKRAAAGFSVPHEGQLMMTGV